MPNFLNTVNNLNPVEFSLRSSNLGVQKRQSVIKTKNTENVNTRSSMQEKPRDNNLKAQTQNTKERTESKSESNKEKQDSTLRSDSVNERKAERKEEKAQKDTEVKEVKDRVLKKETSETNSETEKDFKKTLTEKSDSSSDDKPFLEKIDEKDLEEGVQDLIQAIISMVQELSDDTQNKVEIDINVDINIDKTIDIDVDLEEAANLDPNLLTKMAAEGNKDISSSAISDLLQQFADTMKLEGESAEPEKLLEIVNQLLNSESFADLKPSEKIDLAQELNSLLSEKIDALKEKIGDLIRNVDLENLSLKDIDLDDDHDVKLDDNIQSKLESIIQLGEKSETLDALRKMSDKLAKALDTLEKGLEKLNQVQNRLPDHIREKVINILEPKLDKLLEKFNAEIIEDPSLNAEPESQFGLGLESFDLEDFSKDSSSKDQNSNNPVNLLSKDIKMVMKGTKATKINTRMKATEFVKNIPEMVKETPANSTKELKIRLNPESLGTVDVSITKNANQQLSIQLTVNNDTADKVLRQKILELTASLAEKGVSIEDINVSKSESGGANAQGQNPNNQNSFNEASEEQRKQQNSSARQNTTEASKDQRSFQNELLGILKK
ncbi:MAG: flagellar hook-length control protein FliK [Candidatus Caenarcaniphilales bacterium]|nr:flagellar hook-length control protein FliK [Candidatus Caenarcaniphilales bacterium]